MNIRVPVLMSLMDPITEHFEFYANGGFFWEKIFNDEFEYLNSSIEDVYEGSNVGAQLQIGLFFNPSDRVAWEERRFGIVLGLRSSFDLESTNNSSISNTQNLGDIFSISFVSSFRF